MTGHKAWVVGFSRTRESFEFEPPPGLTPLDAARAKHKAAVAAGAHERGWYGECSSHIGGCGWRGEERPTKEEAAADARAHDPASYDEHIQRAEKAEVERAEKRDRAKRAAERQPYHEETLPRLLDAVLAADRAWEADVENRELAKAYRSAKATFRAAEKAAIADDYSVPCGRCGGTGNVPPWGVCFNCHGFKRMSYHPYKFQADPGTRARRTAKARAKQAAEDAAYTEALAKLPAPVAEALDAARTKFEESDEGWDALSREENFRAELAGKLRKYGSLSEKQVAAVERGLERDQKRAEEKEALKDAPPLVPGRRVVLGKVLSDKWSEDRGFGSQHKILVREDDGNKVWGTLPRALEEKLQRGDHHDAEGMWVDVEPEVAELRGSRVRFTATVERSQDDPHFGFFKRPAQAAFVTKEEER